MVYDQPWILWDDVFLGGAPAPGAALEEKLARAARRLKKGGRLEGAFVAVTSKEDGGQGEKSGSGGIATAYAKSAGSPPEAQAPPAT